MIRLGLRAQLLGTAAVALILMTVIGGMCLVSLGSVNDLGQRLYNEDTVPINQLNSVNTALVDRARAVVYGAVQGIDATTQAKLDTQIAADEAVIKRDLDSFRSNSFVTQAD